MQVLDNNFKSELENIETDVDFDKNSDEIAEAPISTHLRFLTQFFKILYSDLNNRELRTLIQEIQKTYHFFNITNKSDIKNLRNTDFPTINDLYHTICQTLNNEFNAILNEIKEIIKFDFLDDGQYSKREMVTLH